MYKSVSGTTDYKNDTLQFVVVEEDHLLHLPSNFFGRNVLPPAGDRHPLLSKFTLKQFLDRTLLNPIMIDLFSSDQALLCQIIVQVLQALAFMNEQGISHQDLNPQSIIIELIDSSKLQPGPFQQDLASLTAEDFIFKFRIKLSEYLHIKMLSDIAFQKSVLMQTQVQMAQE